MIRTAETFPQRRTDELHKGRYSFPGSRYFVTFVTQRRTPWLSETKPACAVLDSLRAWHDEENGTILAATVMPDHVHVIFALGTKLSAGQCVGRWKSEVRRTIAYRHDWLRDFYEHRLRPDESVEDYALYVFLNPYRARLINPRARWTWWWAPEPRLFHFSEMLNADGTPPAEWLGWPDERFARLAIGE